MAGGVIREGTVSTTYFGHASLMIKGRSKIIYVDPYVLPSSTVKADIILITHEHHDHCTNVEKLVKGSTVIIGPKSVADKLKDTAEVQIIDENGRTEVDDVVIEGFPSYNIGKPYHPQGSGIGFIVNIEGVRIYIAGDTDRIPEMDNLENIDIAFVPIGGTYTMDSEAAADAVTSFKPKKAVPIHYNYLPGLEANPVEFQTMVEAIDSNIDVVII